MLQLPNSSADIEEPLLSESRHYVKKGYLSALSSIIIIYILLAIGLRFAWGDTVSQLSVDLIPISVTNALPYTPNHPPSQIKIAKGDSKHVLLKSFKRAPFIFIEPIQAVFDARAKKTSDRNFEEYKKIILNRLLDVFSHPDGADGYNTYTFIWNDSQSQLDDLIERVTKSIKKKKYNMTTLNNNQNKWDIEFRQKIDLYGTYTIENFNLTREGVEKITVTITLPK